MSDVYALLNEMDSFLADARCHGGSPGVPWLDHCAACCHGSGWEVSSGTELELCETVDAAARKIRDLMAQEVEHA